MYCTMVIIATSVCVQAPLGGTKVDIGETGLTTGITVAAPSWTLSYYANDVIPPKVDPARLSESCRRSLCAKYVFECSEPIQCRYTFPDGQAFVIRSKDEGGLRDGLEKIGILPAGGTPRDSIALSELRRADGVKPPG